ncbi:unnamed protein product, partial [Brassica rapa subsp. trilocularis]
MEMSMKLSEDFTKKLGFSEEGEEIRKLERSWSKLEDSIGRGSRRGRRVLVCLTNASIRISKGNNDDLVEVVLRLREDVLGDRGSVSARNPPPARSDHAGFTLPPFVSSVPEYASVDFDQRRETGESSLGMVPSDRFYGYESSFSARDHGLVSVGSILIWR